MDDIEATPKPKFKNVIAIAGLETLKNKKGVPYKWAYTFINNVETWIKDNWDKKGGGKATILDARDFKDYAEPITGVLDAMIAAAKDMPDGLDALFYTGHGDMETLYVFSKSRTDLPDSFRFIMLENLTWHWPEINWSTNPNKGIWLSTCRAGGDEGKKWETCIAQYLANETKVRTWGFLWRSSQKQRADKGYFQKPEHGDYVAFDPLKENIVTLKPS